MSDELRFSGNLTLALEVRDRKQSARWYENILGCRLLYDVVTRSGLVRWSTPTVVLVLTTLPAIAGSIQSNEFVVDRVGWLAGCWEGTLSNGATYEESWLAPRGGTLIGVARMTRDGRTVSWEYMRIVDDEGTLVYIAEPSGQAATRFRAVAITTTSASFANPEHDFPQRIHYRLTPPAELLARIEGERDGEPRGIDFPLQRVACPG